MLSVLRKKYTRKFKIKSENDKNSFKSQLKFLRSKMSVDRTLLNMNFENFCNEYSGKLFWEVVKILPPNFFACVFILTAYDLNFQILFCKHLIFSYSFSFLKFLTNIKCLFSWENSIQSVNILVMPNLLQLQIYISKTDNQKLSSDLPTLFTVSLQQTIVHKLISIISQLVLGSNYKFDFKLYFCLMWLLDIYLLWACFFIFK